MSNLWPPQWDTLWADVQAGEPWVLAAGGVLGVLLAITLVVLVIRSLRGRDLNAKASIGFGVVQTGLAFITITGVYEFFNRLLDMPWAEAALLAVIIEACMWAAVGMIYAYAKERDEDGALANFGFGPAGPFFWLTIVGGGLLAILGSDGTTVAIGRIVVVVLGAYMWYLRLLQVTRRSSTPSRWRWTPKALLLAVGAIVPGDEDVKNEAREWQVRKLAKAIRWANSRQPWRWIGERAIMRGAEQAPEDVIAEARRRYAVQYVTRQQVGPTTRVMAAVIKSVEREALGGGEVPAVDSAAALPALLAAEVQADEPRTNGHHPDLSVDLSEVTFHNLPGQTDRQPDGQANGHRTEQLPVLFEQSRPPAPEQTDSSNLSAAIEPGLSAAGAAAWREHSDNLLGELRAMGKLSRYRVEKLTGLHAGQASKVRELAHERAGVPLPE